MKTLSKLGGVAALYQAAAYLLTMVIFLVVLDYPSIVTPEQKMALLLDHSALMFLTTLLAYVVFGATLVVLALALHDRLKAAAPALMPVATAFGLIWAAALIASGMVSNLGLATVVELHGQDPAAAMSAWLVIETIAHGLGGANGEILGGLWTLLVSWAALRTAASPRVHSYLGLAVGLVGIASTVPVLVDLTGLFGLSQIVWFVWLGIILLRRPTPALSRQPRLQVATQ